MPKLAHSNIGINKFSDGDPLRRAAASNAVGEEREGIKMCPAMLATLNAVQAGRSNKTISRVTDNMLQDTYTN